MKFPTLKAFLEKVLKLLCVYNKNSNLQTCSTSMPPRKRKRGPKKGQKRVEDVMQEEKADDGFEEEEEKHDDSTRKRRRRVLDIDEDSMDTSQIGGGKLTDKTGTVYESWDGLLFTRTFKGEVIENFIVRDTRENDYKYDHNVAFDDESTGDVVSYSQDQMTYSYPIPNNKDTLNITKAGDGRHFPPMRAGLDGMWSYSHVKHYEKQIASGVDPKKISWENVEEIEDYSLMDMMEVMVTYPENKKIIREEMLETVTRSKHEKDIVYAGTVKWFSPSMYGDFLIYMYEKKLIRRYIIDKLGEQWATSKTTALKVMVVSLVANMMDLGSSILRSGSIPDEKKLSDIESLMNRMFRIVNDMIVVFLGPEAHASVREKLTNIDNVVIHSMLTQSLRYTTEKAASKKPNKFIIDYTDLKIKVDKVTGLVGDVNDRVEVIFKKYIMPQMKKLLDEEPYMKSVRATTKAKRQQMLNLLPKTIDEARIWDVATEMVKKIFPVGYSGKWDSEYIYDGDPIRLYSALSLIQMCIGSRSRGVISVNTFTMFDNAMDTDDDSVKLFSDKQHLVTVDRITKEKLKSLELATRLAGSFSDNIKSKYDEAIDQIENGDDAVDAGVRGKSSESIRRRQEDDRSQRRITKPVQHYFLDPSAYAYVASDRADRLKMWSSSDPSTHDPRRVFCRLVEFVRKEVPRIWSEKNPDSGLVWDIHPMGFGIEHNAVSRESEYEHRGELNKLSAYFNKEMNKVIKTIFSKTEYLPSDQLAQVGTHELRRLYVCYAYQMFGVQKMKEVSFARAVLRHDSFEATLFYTSIQVVMTVGATRSGSSELSEYALKQIKEAKDVVDLYRKKVEELERETKRISGHVIEMSKQSGEKKKVVEDRLLSVVDENGELQMVEYFKRKVRHSNPEERIQEGRNKVAELRSRNIKPTYTLIRKLGMDRKYMADVLRDDVSVKKEET